MGDADVGASSLDSGDAGGLAASRALMEGGSLPPRKRLLAGLKQNGWLSTSPPPAEESPTAGGYVSAPVSVGGVARSGSGKYEDGCMGCKAVESNGLRRIKRGGISLRLCSACTQLYSKSMFCPHCLAMYHDASLLGDPSMWLVCTRCRRSVHPECEQKHSGSKPDAASYVCLDCVNSVRRQREANGVTGMRSKHGSGRPVPNFHGETNSGASPVDFNSLALKKPRLHRERSSRPGDHDGSRFERHRPSPDASGGARATSLGPPRKVSSSQPAPLGTSASPQEAAVTAKNAAIAATKVALAAKANAAAKAGAAVKAAATAKTALEAAALAAKAEAACRAELRRKTGNSDSRVAAGGGAMRLEINVHSEPRRERGASMKHEGDDGYAGRRPSVDDEELARQLHRVINSSPRISRSMTPMRRKNPSVKPETPSSGVSNSSAETVRARPRTNPSPVEPEAKASHDHHQFRHQQTRPRSITHKEFRRLDSRVLRHADKGIDQGEAAAALEPPSQAALSHMGDDGQQQPAEEPAVKSEAMDGVMFAPVGVHDDASILFDALVEAEGEGLHAAAAAGDETNHDRRPDYLQEILEAAVLSDAAMFNNGAHHDVSDLETVRPEIVTAAEQGQEPLDSSPADPKHADGEPGDATKATPGEATVAMTVDTGAAEATHATAADVTDTIAVELAETTAVEVAETTAVELAETTGVDLAETAVVEELEVTAVDLAETAAVELAETAAVEEAKTMAVEGKTLEQDAETGATVVQDVEMQEVGSGDAAPADEAMAEPSSGAAAEERVGGEAAMEETRMEAAVEETRVEEAAVEERRVEAAVEETRMEAAMEETRAEEAAVEERRVEAAVEETRMEAAMEETRAEEAAVEERRIETAVEETRSEAAMEETRIEEAAVEETRIEADASPPGGPLEETKLDASQSKAPVAAGVTAAASASQQSG